MRLYFAGSDNYKEGHNLLQANGAGYRLLSYLYLKGDAPNPGYEHLLIDSGGFSARYADAEISVEAYAMWLDMNGIRHAFNLDTNDVGETLDNQRYLEEHTEAYILPIYHWSDYVTGRELLEQWISDGYPFIGLGGVAFIKGLTRAHKAELYDFVFSKTRDQVAVHALGITGKHDLLHWPWYSADSTSWLASMRGGKSPAIIHTGLNRRVPHDPTIRRVLMRIEIDYYLESQRQATTLWESRGVHWAEPPTGRRTSGLVSSAV